LVIPNIRINNNILNNIRINMESYFNNINLLKIFAKWKWHFLIIAVIAVVLAFIFSSPVFLKPKFKSTAILYPSNIAPYSDESQSEQMLQWLNSQDIKDSVMSRFKLAAHYNIDSSNKYFNSEMLALYDKNVRIAKTQYESIEIAVLDTDPELARDMANAIMEFCNKKIKIIHRIKYGEVVNATRRMLDLKKIEMDTTENRLRALGVNYNLIDYSNQSLEITKGYLRTVEGGSNINTKDVLRLKKNFEEKGGELILLKDRLGNLTREYSDLMVFYDKALYDAEKDFTFINVITKPQVADKKSYPTRWLIMLYVVAATLVFSLVIISIIDNRQGRDQNRTSNI
jgi:capsule polysaccharide export protein KpsE/RkpR